MIDGLVPKFVYEKQKNILFKSMDVWEQLGNDQNNKEKLFSKIMETYGSRCYMTELINAAMKTNSNFFVAPYFSTP